ncbi:glycosyltransferase (plasmid) [Deinococcus taeanensis]|uniref:glycosyltransferase n=1 Tax=Deinococcus taeanensis TaxID=2737050 RepID=UPI001CDD5802|nr:glycosyltransferase [Deinococcus taeanensis]UBV44323.1 glycosyltransferase [Deinococcus taeanensis]
MTPMIYLLDSLRESAARPQTRAASRGAHPVRPLKILAVLPSLWPGGAEMQLAHLLTTLPADEFQCELVTLFTVSGRNALSDRLDRAGCRWTDLGVAPALDRPMGALHAARNLLEARRRLRASIQNFQPDVVYSRLWYAGLAVGSLNRRRLDFVHITNEELSLFSHADKGVVKRWLRRWVVAQADHWVVPTRGLYDQFVERGAPRRRGHVIHNATPLPESVTARVPAPPLRVAAMGRLVADKGFERLLHVARLLRDAGHTLVFDVAGEGPERPALEHAARALGVEDCVHFVGYVPDPLAFLQAHDAFVLTSHAEGFANVLVEAMACALPTVAFDIDHGPRELIVHGETGYLAADGDLGAFAGHLRALAQAPDRGAALGQAGRQRAERLFSIPQMTAAFGALFQAAARPPLQTEGA